MKIALFFSGEYSMSLTFQAGFEKLGHEVHIVNYNDFTRKISARLDHYGTIYPSGFRNHVREKLLKQIQIGYISKVKLLKPDLVLAYNDQMVTAETVAEIKGLGIRYAVYLADSPFFLQRRNHLFKVLINANHIFAPDTFWLKQLNILGIKHTSFLIIGYDDTLFFPLKPSTQEMETYGADVFYLGSPYKTIWGNKRAHFLNLFTGMNFKFYGPPSWKKWFGEFPNLKHHYVENTFRISDKLVNIISNCCKIYPVDANPGLIHGLHVRTLDCIGSGILPLVEYRSDLERVFHGVEIPIIHDYREASELAGNYLTNESHRSQVINRLRDHLNTNYSPEKSVSYLLKKIFR